MQKKRLVKNNHKEIGQCLFTSLRSIKYSGSERSLAVLITEVLFCFCLAIVSLIPGQAVAEGISDQLTDLGRPVSAGEMRMARLTDETHPAVPQPQPRRANFNGENRSRETQHMADWVVDSGDNLGVPFVIVDKMDAKIFVFDADGRLRGVSAALLGLARGDDSVPGIGDRKLSDIRPEERTTPAGRFVASLGYNFNGKDVLWVDYKGAVSLHRVVSTKPSERRLQRLATPTPLDNRISYGCINVPVKFFNDIVSPTFAKTRGIVYVLPEVRSKNEIFAAYYDVSDVEERLQTQN